MKNQSEWWHEFFPSFRPVFERIPAKATNAIVRHLIKKLNLEPGMKFLDCPCGIGRIALPLARKGINITGVDFMQSYLEELERRAKNRKLKIRTVKADMRRINYQNEFHAAANIWTSFGYFDKESDNMLVLKKMYKALKPGGRFLMLLLNRDYVVSNFMAKDWFTAGNTRVFTETEFDYRTSKMKGRWHFVEDGIEKKHEMTIRLYSYHELAIMMERAGFIDIEGYGSIKDEPINKDSNGMLILGVKPRR
ncbi:MAG: methyltransferase domain-containing protein [candidate division Zixibacteria bacterium]|nr:methyltransferase domain-containing protein [candidate division Zixibacteria bacterium]